MKKTIAFCCLILCFSFSLTMLGQQVTFQKTFGNSRAEESAYAIIQATNNSLYLGGIAQPDTGRSQCLLIKSSLSGEQIWLKQYGYPGYHSFTYSLIQSDSKLLLCGDIKTETGECDAMLICVDTTGQLMWQKSYGIPSLNESLKNIKLLPDGGFIACGFITETRDNDPQNDILVMKFSPNGELIWQQAYGFENNDYADAIEVVDDGYVLTADVKQSSLERNDYDIYVMKIDTAGNLMWDIIVGDELENGCQSATISSSGDFMVVGESTGAEGPAFDLTVVRVNSAGGLVYFKNIPVSGADAGFSIAEFKPDTFLITGYSNSNSKGSNPLDVLLSIIDGQGNELSRDTPTKETFYAAGKAIENGDSQAILIGGFNSVLNGINHTGNGGKLKIYPQPASSRFFIQWPNSLLDGRISLYNTEGGKIWFENLLPSGEVVLPPTLQSGVYLAEIIVKTGVYHQLISIQNPD